MTPLSLRESGLGRSVWDESGPAIKARVRIPSVGRVVAIDLQPTATKSGRSWATRGQTKQDWSNQHVAKLSTRMFITKTPTPPPKAGLLCTERGPKKETVF